MGNQIRSDGASRVPDGVEDLAAIGNESEIDLELEKQISDLLDLTEDKSKARFKLEVIFAAERSRMESYPGVIVAWTNGGFASGGGDEVVYFCTASVEKDGETRSCNAPLDLKFVSREIAVCPTCCNVIKPQELTGQVMARLTSQNWAKLLTRMFMLLEANADIRMGFMPGDLRGAAKVEQDKPRHGDVLNRVRLERNWVHYALKDIIRDTSTGSSLYQRIRVFLEA